MTSAITGNATEAAVLAAFVRRGLAVMTPFGDGQPFDLVVHLGGAGFLRVQCKTARRRGGVMLFNARTTDHGRGRVTYLGLADAFGIYAPWSGEVYLVPVNDVSTYVHTLRIEPTRNNQQRRIRFADRYRIDQWSTCELAGILESEAAGTVPTARAA